MTTREYKATELGRIPEDWAIWTLGELGATYSGLSGKSGPAFGHGDGLYVPFTNVMRNVVTDLRQLERVEVLPGERQNVVVDGDVLFNGSSETPEELGYASYVSRPCGALYLNSFCFGYRIKRPDIIDGLFLAYWSRSIVGRQLLQPLAQGSTRYNLSKRSLLSTSIYLPPVDEQREIAAVLSDGDALASELKARLEKTRLLNAGIGQQLISGKTQLNEAAEG